MKISAVIIAKNEEVMLSDCLATLKWADEIVLIDNGSTDNTAKIARSAGARVINFPKGKNYSDLRKKGASEAKFEWILYVDADERIPENLAREVVSIVKSESALNAYAIPRRNFVLGKELKHGGFWPDYQKRFFRKKGLSGWSGKVHEEPIFKGELGLLVNPMLHIKHEDLSQMVEKTNNWSEIEGRLMLEANHPPMNVLRFLSAMAREFWLRMIAKKAFLDGKIGVIFALYQVFSKFVSYAKLWEMQLTQNESSNS